MAFDALGSALLSSSSVELATNSPSGLSVPLPFGSGAVSFNTLNAFAQPIDQSAQRQYIESGIIRNIKPRSLEVLMQTPDTTVLVKKRQFSSLAENYRFDFMNSDEKLFIKAVKRLFYNKCNAIAAYEKLTKIEQIAINSGGVISDTALPMIFGASDTLNSLAPGLISSQTQSVIDTIRKIKMFSDPVATTTWLIDPTTPTSSDIGEGTGVFELTNIANVSCTNSTKFMGGSAELTIEDPYKLMLITSDDIDQAIAEASAPFQQNSFYAVAQDTLSQTIGDLKSTLNSLRDSRGVLEISFQVNQSTLLYNKVIAYLSNGQPVNFTFDGGFLGIGSSATLDASATQGINGINTQEAAIFSQIVQNSYNLLALQQTNSSEVLNLNTQTNYVRTRMKMEFCGKPIIQPMDIVHIYIGTKTIEDSMLTQGLNVGFDPTTQLNNLNNTISNVENSINSLASAFGGGSGGSSYMQVEKDAIAGPDFPMWLWTLMRNDFTRQSAGMHTFAGIVENSSHSYGNGSYNLRVNVGDNTTYFKYSKININPSLDVYNGALYDPLTPFVTDFDLSSGLSRGEFPQLLDENIRLLNSGSVKAKLGRFRGSLIDEDSYKILDIEKMAADSFRAKLSDPDGFAYRWKQGIGSLIMFGEPHNPENYEKERSPSLTKNPFAGQDVMNVLSLLITGQPYNFNNFVRAAQISGNLNRNDLFNQGGSASYFRGLINDLTIGNSIWGNFIPFKKMIVNESGTQFLQSGQFDISTTNSKITQLLNTRAQSFDELTSILPQFANNPQFYKTGSGGAITIDPSIAGVIDTDSLSKLATNIINLDSQIQQQSTVFQSSLQNPNLRSSDGTLTIIGNDVSFDPTVTSNTALTPDQIQDERSQMRDELNALTQRRFWKVKANEDVNYFIVDDSYDKNYDIQQFETGLTEGFNLFNSTYATVAETITNVASMLEFEVFADSQGHIQARAPQYNKMPSSVFYTMLSEKDTKGIQIFPDYLESLFINQIDSLTDQISIIEDQIRIRCAALGYTDDNSAQTLLRGSTSSTNTTGNSSFTFVTDPNTGLIGGTDLRALLVQASPDVQEANFTTALDTITSSIAGAATATVNFDVVQRISVVNTTGFGGVDADINDAIATIGARLAQETGQPAPTKQNLLPNNNVISGRSQLDVLNLTQQISQFLSERQNAIKSLTNAVKNLDQGLALNTNSNSQGTNSLFPSLSQSPNSQLPQIIEHMLEDETVDDLGVGSGQRYIIEEKNIISFTLNETPPQWNAVQVNGALAGGLVQGPSGLEVGQGGNGISSAFAIDYDMWRLYGFRGEHPANLPFLSDPGGQCAPYAVFLLHLARKQIFSASLTCVGNEYYQAGEVYYIDDYDLLFYVESVTHSITYGQQYTTSMRLTFGHNPGEYIPTILDIIGKGLYTNKGESNSLRHVRHGNANNETPLTILISDPSISGGSLTQLLQGAYGDQNNDNLVNITQSINTLLSSTLYGNQVAIELRIYYNSSAGFSSANSSLVNTANDVISWLKTPSKNTQSLTGASVLPDNSVSPNINLQNVSVVQVDIGKSDETRSSASSQAWSIARSLVLTGGTTITVTPVPDPSTANQTQLAQQEMQSLFNNVIDVWATFSPATTGVIQPNSPSTPNQSDQQQTAQYITAFNQRLGITS